MSELVTSFLISLVGGGAGIGVVVFALSKWLGGIWSERIRRLEDARVAIEILQQQATIDTVAREQQSALDERLKILEQDHEKLLNKDEHFHQISQQTYENIFEKKVEVYMKLISLKQRYLSNKEVFRLPDSTKTHHGRDLESFLKVKETIEENRFCLSNTLIEIYDQWYENAYKYFVAATEDVLNASIESVEWTERQRFFLQKTITEASDKQLNMMLEETKIFIELIFKTIDTDVQVLKSKYDI